LYAGSFIADVRTADIKQFHAVRTAAVKLLFFI